MASPFDLVSLADLKRWLDVAGSDDDDLLARLITQMSRAILNVLDRPSILPATYTETHDSACDHSILLRQWPVHSILSCSANGQPLQASILAEGMRRTGYLLDPPDAAPPGVMQRLSFQGIGLPAGLQNLKISYTAGYQITKEPVMVPATPPYALSVLAPYGAFAGDGGVTYADDTPLALVSMNPGAGEYANEEGTYTFSSADAGASLRITYGYVPAELASCCIEWAAERYAYRSRVGQRSKSLGGHETIAYVVTDIPAYVARCLQPYRRVVTP